MADNDEYVAECASPPCYAHELDPLYAGLSVACRTTHRDVMRWRRAERQRLYHLRNAITKPARQQAADRIADALTGLVSERAANAVGAYWPIRGEPDLRGWMRELCDSGIEVSLPVVVDVDAPLRYARWYPATPMTRGRWGIAEPAEPDWTVPDLVVVPLLGVDRRGYRLGNGGGYFDRTLATADPRPCAVGVGYEQARIDTIYPLPHDMAMDRVVTG